MTLDVYRGRKTTIKQQQQQQDIHNLKLKIWARLFKASLA